MWVIFRIYNAFISFPITNVRVQRGIQKFEGGTNQKISTCQYWVGILRDWTHINHCMFLMLSLTQFICMCYSTNWKFLTIFKRLNKKYSHTFQKKKIYHTTFDSIKKLQWYVNWLYVIHNRNQIIFILITNQKFSKIVLKGGGGHYYSYNLCKINRSKGPTTWLLSAWVGVFFLDKPFSVFFCFFCFFVCFFFFVVKMQYFLTNMASVQKIFSGPAGRGGYFFPEQPHTP